MDLLRTVFLVVVVLLAVGGGLSQPAYAESRWISDQFEVTMRRGKGTNQGIVRVLRTGTEVELLEVDEEAEYSLVRTSGGTEGWVLNRFLMSEPTAREQLVTARQQLAAANSRIAELDQSLAELRQQGEVLASQLASAENSGADVQRELARVQDVSANALEIDDQNKLLKQRLIDGDRRVAELENEVQRLGSRATREWFIVGAGVLLFGLILGLIVPRMRWKKRSSWGDL
jgi:SH3 domain protein